MTTKHTPTPWAVFYNGMQNGRGGQSYIGTSNHNAAFMDSPCGKQIAWPTTSPFFEGSEEDKKFTAERDANAAFIVKAVNNHESLFAALKSAKWMLERDFIDPQKLEIIRKCDAAIEAAEGDA